MAGVGENTKNLALSMVFQIESVLRGVEKVPDYLAALIETHPYGREDLLRLIRCQVSRNDEIYGVCVAFEPYRFAEDSYYFAPYYLREEDGGIGLRFLGSSSYPYSTLDWYVIPKRLQLPIWSEPYYDEGAGEIVMTTYSVPFYTERQEERVVRGVVVADISLEWLNDVVSKTRIYETGYVFLISRNGVFVSHPDKNFILRESIFSVAETRGDRQLREIGRDMIRGREGLVPMTDFVSGKKAWIYYAPLPSSGWSVGVVIHEDNLFADVRRLGRQIIFLGAVGLAALAVTLAFISGTITRPLRLLARKAGEIAAGNLNVDLPQSLPRDEVGDLSRSFEDMRAALKEYIDNLAQTTAAKERIESELKIARTIQMSFLPKRFPPCPEGEVVEIHALLEPAKEVGGDFYDYFLIDEDHLFFGIGDVSGKGVPAALFMAVTKTLLKGMAEAFIDPSRILSKVNKELCHENDSTMFVSVFCAVLNLKTGELRYSNAGHNPPLFMARDGETRWLKVPKGFLLGGFEASRYKTETMTLGRGDLILLYTDGVTEAMNAEEAFYSNERLIRTTGRHQDQGTEDLVNGVVDSVKTFSDGASQSDDITLLAVRFLGNRHT